MSRAVTVYDTVVAIHVVLVVGAFGVLFAYPWLPAGTAPMHHARHRLLSVVVERGALGALLAGLYLASDRDLLGELWVIVPLVILIALGALVGAVLIPRERRLAELGPGDAGRVALERTVTRVALGCAALVAVAVFFMIAKPG